MNSHPDRRFNYLNLHPDALLQDAAIWPSRYRNNQSPFSIVLTTDLSHSELTSPNYPSFQNMLDVIKNSILKEDPIDVVSKHVIEKTPFIFKNDWESYRKWRRKLALLLDVESGEIAVTGSAAVGFSLSPYKNLKPFDEDSDVDVAVVSDRHFSEAWRHLRGINLFTETLSAAQRSAIREHQSNYIYWGCIATDKILPVLPFSAQWLSGLNSMANENETLNRTINARIYKDFNSLYKYQKLGINKLKNKILSLT